jgi:hypothetical protein
MHCFSAYFDNFIFFIMKLIKKLEVFVGLLIIFKF